MIYSLQTEDEVMTMNEKLDLLKIKKNMESYVGGRIRLRANKGRKKSFVRDGILESMHQSIFVVKFEGESHSERRMSFMYIDVLTKTVEIMDCKDSVSVNCEII